MIDMFAVFQHEHILIVNKIIETAWAKVFNQEHSIISKFSDEVIHLLFDDHFIGKLIDQIINHFFRILSAFKPSLESD